MFVNNRFFSSTQVGFSENVSRLLQNISKKERILTISIFGLVEKDEYRSNLEIIEHSVRQAFVRLPLLSYIAQSPENENTLIAEVCYLSDEISLTAVSHNEIAEGRYLTIKTNEFSALLVEGILADDISKPLGVQSSAVFGKIRKIMETSSMPVQSIVRQWNYIGQITSEENNRQNYQEFNNERARFYKGCAWENGFPAATGISMNINILLVSLMAVEFHNETQILPVDNSMQLAAHRYSETVLGSSTEKQTPKFERAKLIVKGQSACCFISGTAAILGEKSMDNDCLKAQTSQTISLIRHLISPENRKVNGIDFSSELKMVHLRVYVKQSADFEKVREVVEAELPGINVFYVCAPVCRDELLVEIEGVAITES